MKDHRPLPERDTLYTDELAMLLYSHSSLTKGQAREAIAVLPRVVLECLQRNQKLVWTGFGTIANHRRAARRYCNARTGAWKDLPETVTPMFQLSESFRKAVKEGLNHDPKN